MQCNKNNILLSLFEQYSFLSFPLNVGHFSESNFVILAPEKPLCEMKSVIFTKMYSNGQQEAGYTKYIKIFVSVNVSGRVCKRSVFL